MQWTKYVRFSDFDSFCLISNQINNQYFKISFECLKYLQDAINQKMNADDFIKAFEDEEDVEYMRKLIRILYDKLMLSDKDIEIQCNQMNITWYLTRRCNLCCKHCSLSADNSYTDLSSENLLEIAHKIADIHPRTITLSGGEPLVSDAFYDIVKIIRNTYKGTLILMTNATLIGSHNVKFIAKNFDVLNISLDGYDEESCSQIRGRGVFQKVIEAVELLKANGCDNISLSMVKTKINDSSRDQFIDLCNGLGVKYIFRKFESMGRGAINREILQIETNTELEIIKKPNSSSQLKPSAKAKALVRPMVFSCKASITEFLINETGDILPCVLLFEKEFQMGNILNIDDLKIYLESGEYRSSNGYKNFMKYNPFNLSACKKCKYQMLCHNCVAQIKQNINNGTFLEECEKNKCRLKDLIS